MAKDPAFPWYASDWLGSTNRALMSLEQQAAYMNLLCHQWGDPTCSLPDDDATLYALAGASEGCLDGGLTLVRDCFPAHPVHEGRLANHRLLEVREDRNDWIAKSRAGGLNSAKVRRAKSKPVGTSDNGKGGLTTVPTKRQPKGNTPLPSPSSFPSPSPSSFPLPKELDTPEFHTAWDEFMQHRKNIQKPVTALARTKLLNKAVKMGIPTAIEAIDEAIAARWTSIFPPKGVSKPPQRETIRPEDYR